MASASLSRLRSWLPDGSVLSEADWAVRHRVMTWVLAVHPPVIVIYAVLAGNTLVHGVLEAVPPTLLVIAAARSRSRLVGSLGVAFGLVTCSAIFVHLSHGLIEWHFHYFVTLAIVALYQEWRVYAMALAFVVVQHGLGSWLRFHDVYNHGHGELWWALVHGGFVLAASAAHVAAWRFNEISAGRAEAYRRELHDGEQSVVARLKETAQMRSDLIATASHEFRTPLTVISGAAATLRRHADALSPAERSALLTNIATRADRLGLMLESMLIAAQLEPAEDAATPLMAAVDEVLPPHARAGVVVDVPDYVWVRVARRPLGQLLERLLDSARQKGDLGAHVQLVARVAHGQARIEVRVGATGLSPDAIDGIFDPFRGGTDVMPRSADVGLALYAVRRIAEAHGGSADVALRQDSFVVEVRLPQATVDLPVPRLSAVNPAVRSAS